MTALIATAVAHPNIALAKYWGKRPDGHNLPAVPSLSVTLAGMATTTTVRFEEGLGADTLALDGRQASPGRIGRILGEVRRRAGLDLFARVESRNDFPTASGLASSASAFAALAVAASHAAGLRLSAAELSSLARRTSVSSARSVLGGFVELRVGSPAEESSLAAELVAPPEHMDLCVIVGVTAEGPKEVGSSEGMRHTVATSPYFDAWTSLAPGLFAEIRAAVLAADLAALGPAAEQSALAMHASAIAARPGLIYWSAGTLEALAAVRRMRADGLAAWSTIDAGPHVKVLTTAADAPEVTRRLALTPGVLRTIHTSPGEGARVVEAP